MKRKWTEKEKILAHRKLPPPECIGCYFEEPEKGEYHMFVKGALCKKCAIEVKSDAHRSFFGVKDRSASHFFQLLKEAHAIHLQAEEIMINAAIQMNEISSQALLPGFDSIYQN